MYTGVSIVSMLEHNSNDTDIEYVLLDDGLDDGNREKLLSIFKSYDVTCEVKNTLSCYQYIVSRINWELKLFNGSKTTWLRMFPDLLFPGYEGVIMYIDSDTIIEGPLKELHHLDWGDKIICASLVLKPDIDRLVRGSAEETRILKEHNGRYFNAGIVLYNMRNFLRRKAPEKISASVSQLKEYRFSDQTVLNNAFSVEELLPLPTKFNYTFHARPKHEIRWPGDEIREEKDPVIIHYPGHNCRPWYRESISNLAYKFKAYQELSPWKGIQESYYDTAH